MTDKKACAHSGNYGRTHTGSARTRSIVADESMFRVVMYSTLFMLGMLAIPTIMALLKCWGVW